MSIFIMLAIAAFLTAFYTMRQISLTFLGEPRTPLAEHAHESNRFMTTPLIILAFFAVSAGWVGIPDDFLGTSGTFTNRFHHFVAPTIEETISELHAYTGGEMGGEHGEAVTTEHGEAEITDDHGEATTTDHGEADTEHAASAGGHGGGLVAHELTAPPFKWVPVITSIVVALGGLGLRYLVYGRNPLKAGEPDPLVRPLGPIHTFLLNKWYWDELYNAIFVKPVVYFSEKIVYPVIDKGLIDGLLHLVAGTMFGIGRIARETENAVFGRGVDRIKDGFLWFAREFRSIQTGKIQEYALISTFMTVALVIVIVAAYVYQIF